MRWVRLNCLNSSDELEITFPPLTQRLRSSSVSNALVFPKRELSLAETRSMRPVKSRTETLSHSRNVLDDRTTGLPVSREAQGSRDFIVVVGVTTHRGGWEINQLQGEGSQECSLRRIGKVCAMQNASHILQALRKMGEKKTPLTRVYRLLYSEDLYLAAYARIYKNDGAMTPGSEADTVDGMSLPRIRHIITQLRHEQYRFRPVRRVEIPKKSGNGTRKLRLPNFTDKLLQEALRMLLEAYYEPQFRDSSHAYRPERGCHTALQQVKQSFRGAAWFIEGDIKGRFDNIDHDVLMNLLARHIHDGRLLQLIRQGLKAGVLDNWVYTRTYSGTPQGGILSPLLSNIYLHELDMFIEDTLIPNHTKGDDRDINPAYKRFETKINTARRHGGKELVKALEQQRRLLPSRDMFDPHFRRLKYVRYADDFILSYIGTKQEAEHIKAKIGKFLQTKLNLQLSPHKTLITHAKTEQARFLNYTVNAYLVNDKCTLHPHMLTKRRSINGHVRLGLPDGLIRQHIAPYMRNGKIVSYAGWLMYSDAHIISEFQARFRGIAEYYQYAVNRHSLSGLKNIMQQALVKTLAHKYKISVSKVYQKYRGTLEIEGTAYRTLQVHVPTKHGFSLIYWGAIPLRVVKPGIGQLRDMIHTPHLSRSDLIQRLTADTCELCGSSKNCEVHHVRKLSDLKQRWAGRREKPAWVERMIAMQRKTLIVCHECHLNIHAGKPTPNLT